MMHRSALVFFVTLAAQDLFVSPVQGAGVPLVERGGLVVLDECPAAGCPVCTGPCTVNSDCLPGLVCTTRGPNDNSPVEGCGDEGQGSRGVRGQNYCVATDNDYIPPALIPPSTPPDSGFVFNTTSDNTDCCNIVPDLGKIPFSGEVTLEGGQEQLFQNTTYVYVIDISLSTVLAQVGSCGDQTIDGRLFDVIDCEVLSLVEVNDAAIVGGNVDLVGLVSFSTAGTKLTPTLIQPWFKTDPRNRDPDVIALARSVTAKTFTNFQVGIEAACMLAEAPENDNANTVIIFVSDGLPNRGTSAVNTIMNSCGGARVNTFAVTGGAQCDGIDSANLASGADPDTLTEMADAGGGFCQQIVDVTQLPDFLVKLEETTLDPIVVKANGVPVPIDSITVTDGSNNVISLPAMGPLTAKYDGFIRLEPGFYEICVVIMTSSSGVPLESEDCFDVVVLGIVLQSVLTEPSSTATVEFGILPGVDVPECCNTDTTVVCVVESGPNAGQEFSFVVPVGGSLPFNFTSPNGETGVDVIKCCATDLLLGEEFCENTTITYQENPSSQPSMMPSAPTFAPSDGPTSGPTKAPTASPSGAPSIAPSFTPSTVSPTTSPTDSPSKAPVDPPTTAPSDEPSGTPTSTPSKSPTGTPTAVPSKAPTGTPTAVPSKAPTGTPSTTPSKGPSGSPTDSPTTTFPSLSPSFAPSVTPGDPTSAPVTPLPSSPPTLAPTPFPTGSPTTTEPTGEPTGSPVTSSPTGFPTKSPSVSPSFGPSTVPSSNPTVVDSAPPSIALRIIAGTVLEDVDSSGSGDEGLAGVKVELVTPDGVVIATTFTDSSGSFIFTDVSPNEEGSPYLLRQENLNGFFDVDDSDGTENGTSLSEILVDVSSGDDLDNVFIDEVGSDAPSALPSGSPSQAPIATVPKPVNPKPNPKPVGSVAPSALPSNAPSDEVLLNPKPNPKPTPFPKPVGSVAPSALPSSAPSDIKPKPNPKPTPAPKPVDPNPKPNPKPTSAPKPVNPKPTPQPTHGPKPVPRPRWSPPSWFFPYRAKFGAPTWKACSFTLWPEYESDPKVGDSCLKGSNDPTYKCGFGEQTCKSEEYPSASHPTKICTCDNASQKWIDCDDAWDPCDGEQESSSPAGASATSEPTSYPTKSPTGPFIPKPQSKWVQPTWFLDYRRKYGARRFHACSYAHWYGFELDPKTGDKCYGSSNHMCGFGSQTCESSSVVASRDNTHPTKMCECDASTGKYSSCEAWYPCDGLTPGPPSGTVQVCPENIPYNLVESCAVPLTCMYGLDSCGYADEFVARCTCNSGGLFVCTCATDACT